MLLFQYISLHFLRYFLIILFALILFLVGFDYMEHGRKMSDAANLVLIYLVYKAFFAIDMLLPLSLLFATIATKVALIRSNALVSFYSLGYTRRDVLRPFVFLSVGIILFYVLLHMSATFSRADEFSNNIRKNSEYLSPTKDLFFTYQDQYVYFAKMLPLQERAEDVRIFTIHEGSLKEVVVASRAYYEEDAWKIKEADIITKPKEFSFQSGGLEVLSQQELKILHGFRPKMLDQVYEGKVNFTIWDALDALWLFRDQNVDTRTIKGALYKIIIYPFFVPCMIVILFFLVPISPRFLNVSLLSFSAILATLLVWSLLFTLIELSNNKTIPSEVGIVLPVVVLFFVALWQWKKHD